MKFYLEGLVNAIGAVVLALLLAMPFGRAHYIEAVSILLYVFVTASGYFYRKRRGPLFTIDSAKVVVAPLLKYLLGWGTLLGPFDLWVAHFPIPGAIPLINALLLIVAVPLGGLSVLPLLFVGSWFSRRGA